MKRRRFETPSRTSPRPGGRRGCLCADGRTYSRKCCNGSLRAQGIGRISATSTPTPPPPAYTPLDDADLYGWWDAQAGVSTSGGELTAWADRSASIPADPPTVVSQPLYGTDTVNGLDVLTFNSADPNYIDIDVSACGSGCDVHIMMRIDSANGVVIADVDENIAIVFAQDSNFSSKAVNNGLLGASVGFQDNGSVIGTDITRGELYSIIEDYAVLTMTNVDLSGVDTLRLMARGDLLLPSDALVGDIIISSGSTNRTDNIDFLIEKYGL